VAQEQRHGRRNADTVLVPACLPVLQNSLLGSASPAGSQHRAHLAPCITLRAFITHTQFTDSPRCCQVTTFTWPTRCYAFAATAYRSFLHCCPPLLQRPFHYVTTLAAFPLQLTLPVGPNAVMQFRFWFWLPRCHTRSHGCYHTFSAFTFVSTHTHCSRI